MNYSDTMITCQQCGREFVFTVTAQRALADKGLPMTPPQYCPRCRELMPLTNAAGKAQGVVKWFNTQKGYGFITLKSGEEVFVHKTGLAEGIRTLNEGQAVEFEVEETIKGPQAVSVTPA
ncbi:MAG: cold shock domain-containing protein [Anaerolineales bacterium]|nr:MAG: cold shock domain-containing protein [Anaerolineales bacterium]